MNAPQCDQIVLGALADYAAGALPEAEAAAIEEHLFSCPACGARAAEFDALVGGIRRAVRSAEVGGFVTDTLLNRLSREGVRVRSLVVSPGGVIPCAVWEGDELLALRLRGDFGAASAITMTQRVAGTEVIRATASPAAGSPGELIYALPASWVRQLPVAQVDVLLTAEEGGEQRSIASYTLVHEGSLQR